VVAAGTLCVYVAGLSVVSLACELRAGLPGGPRSLAAGVNEDEQGLEPIC
jgi:hypothetical protein